MHPLRRGQGLRRAAALALNPRCQREGFPPPAATAGLLLRRRCEGGALPAARKASIRRCLMAASKACPPSKRVTACSGTSASVAKRRRLSPAVRRATRRSSGVMVFISRYCPWPLNDHRRQIRCPEGAPALRPGRVLNEDRSLLSRIAFGDRPQISHHHQIRMQPGRTARAAGALHQRNSEGTGGPKTCPVR